MPCIHENVSRGVANEQVEEGGQSSRTREYISHLERQLL